MRDSFVQALSTLAAADPTINIVTGDLGFGVLTKFAERFPDQFINVGVAEQNMTAIACGLALCGLKTFTYSIANFPTLRCLEQIRNDVCYHNANVITVSIGAGFSYGQLGMSHFATEDLAIMRALPNMRVVVPSEVWEVPHLTAQMVAQGGPGYLRLDKSSGGSERRAGENVELGRARILCDGSDACIIAVGGIVSEVIAAAATLNSRNIHPRVIVLNSLKPIDKCAILEGARMARVLVTVEEHNTIGGLGGAVAEICLEAGVAPSSFKRIGLDDQYPTIVGDQSYLRNAYKMNAAAIVDAVMQGLNDRS